jgi:hypothetical protein
MGASISVMVSSTFQWPFWLAIATAALSIMARIYHPKVSSLKQTVQPISNVPSTPAAVTANVAK